MPVSPARFMLHDLVPDRGLIAAQQWRRRARSRSIQVALIAECFDATAGASASRIP